LQIVDFVWSQNLSATDLQSKINNLKSKIFQEEPMPAIAEAGIENLTINIHQEIEVHASLDITFESLLEQLGSENTRPDGIKMNMKIEPWPGGRWYRDLGDNNGHFWAVVQAIKRPTLLEFHGPLMMSKPAVSNVQYRLSEKNGSTLIKFHHLAFGLMDEEHRTGVISGWRFIHEKVQKLAEAKSAR
jgi:hypothetical protein